MIDQKQVDMYLNHPMFYPALAVFIGAVCFLILLKLIMGSKSSQSEEAKEDGGKVALAKRKKGKKQKVVEKKASGSPKAKDTKKGETDSFMETNKTTAEESKNDKKRDGKSKVKSKKKKTAPAKSDAAPVAGSGEASLDAGEWQTVSTKEQREQQKREKKKLEENVGGSLESVEESKPAPLVQPAIKPTANISAIAKGIAPRFARAAGEEWQGKPLPPQTKRPMPPATVPGVNNQPKTSVAQGWITGPQEKQIWTSDIGGPWPNMPPPTTTGGLSSVWSPDSTSLLSMATTGDKGVMPGWPQGGSTWQPGNGTGNGTWDMGAEEWVHVTNAAQNGRSLNANNESWSGNGSPLHQPTRTGVKKDEEWTLEPEGFPVEPQQLDPNDPWNIEVVGTADNGDWAAPASTWDNTNEEWTAPIPVKPTPTYIDESSDEDNFTSAKVASRSGASNQQNNSSLGTTTSPQTIVGAGPDLMSQPSAQGQGKKSRRRRKKKQTAGGEPEQSTSLSPQQSIDEPELATPETPAESTITKKQAVIRKESEQEQTTKAEPEPKPEVPEPKPQETEKAKDEWTTPKPSKKRKPKARKAD